MRRVESADLPSLATERLALTPHTLDDFAEMAAMWADPEVCRFIGGQPSTSEASSARLLRYRGHWPLFGFGFWTLRERDSARFVGEAGLFHRDLASATMPEAGWVIRREAWGRGYASEALCAVLAWADARAELRRTFCIIEHANHASIRVAEKCGYGNPRPARYAETDLLRFER